MPLAAVIATIPAAAARTKGLYLGGVDVLLAPGAQGNATGTPIETVHVTEAGPDGVSSMEFTIEDPGLTVTVPESADVRFYDHTLNYPIFLGYVQSAAVEPAFGNTGRRIVVIAIGIEAVLDWAVTISDLTFPGGTITSLAAAIQSVVANSQGLGPIRALSVHSLSTQAWPMEDVVSTGNPYSFNIPTGTTVREAIRLIWTSLVSVVPYANVGPLVWVTVDFWYGLRVWINNFATNEPIDYATMTVTDTAASTTNAEGLQHATDYGSIIRAVVVRGAALAVVVSDGSGLPGRVGVVNDSTLTTIAMAQDAGRAYLTTSATGLRGSFGQSDRAASAQIHAGSVVILTDDRIPLASGTARYRIAQIEKTFNPSGRENWTVSYGGLPPSAATLIRRLTRNTLN